MTKKILITLVCIPAIGALGLIATGNGYILTAVERTYMQGQRTANINDHVLFDTHVIETGEPALIPNHEQYNQQALPKELQDFLIEFRSAAYLIVQNGKVVSEHYFSGYHERSKTNSFSMAKTVLTLLIGIAIEDGYIVSLDQALTDFIPEFKDDPLGKNATIGQLSLMNSGYEWTEHYYSPFSPTVELLHGHDVEDFLVNRNFTAEPGSYFQYSSASTQLLGIVLQRALRKKGNQQSISEYLSEKIWQPMQMNDDAIWHTDSSEMELVFCCLNTNARNYAKLGLLMLNNGVWNGRQLVPQAFIAKMIEPVAADHYGYSTWLNPVATPNYYWFSGHLGQYIIVIPDHDMVIVRLGETRGSADTFQEHEIPIYIEHALSLSRKG